MLIDFAETKVFSAITEPCILIAASGTETKRALIALKWDQSHKPENVDAIVRQRAIHIAQADLGEEGWRLESPTNLRLLGKMRRAGKALGESVKGRFYRGILTGLNEAYIIDRATRDQLVASHKSSAEILKPFLRGRDVKRWRAEFAEQYLITIESSENKRHPWSGKSKTEAEEIFEKTYPAIHTWFKPFRKELIQREDQGQYFWELRSCAYYAEFQRPKILYQEINRMDVYAFDADGYYANNKLFMLPDAGPFILGILNSTAGIWFMHTFSGVPMGGFLALQWPIMNEFPIPAATAAERSAIEGLVEKCLAARGENCGAWEAEINARVARLYHLTPDEIKLVEESAK